MKHKADNSPNRRTSCIQMRINADVKEKAQQRADEEGRSLSNYIEWLILKDLKEHNN